MKSSEQMSLGLDSLVAPDAMATSGRVQQPGRSAPRQPAPRVRGETAPELSPDAMARALDAHPDYKVLRRLMPREDWGEVPAGGTRRVIVLDTETTGLDAKSERIIELAMLSVLVDTATGHPVGQVTTYESFEDPGKPIPQAITGITGIDDTMVRGQRIDDARVAELVQAADLIVAHNAGFDRPFVEARLPVFANRPWNCSFAGIDWRGQGSGSAKLEFLAHERGWFYDAHRALTDCHALLQVLAVPLATGVSGLQQLLHGAAAIRYKLRATGAPFEAKDALKARGYRWDGEGRVWWTSLAGEEALQEEAHWLKTSVYLGRHARVLVEAQSALVQFSQRPGEMREMAL
ncbi:MAG: 3'-5' exonuclease [Limnohabitans sp.]|jgi:DNA polymerase III subunit epsilon